jgi:tetratricopeptide (TPR) repeat protein
MKKALIALALVCQVAYPQTESGQACDPEPTRSNTGVSDRLRQLLRKKEFVAVQDEFDDRLRRYEKGEFNDLNLYNIAKDSVRNEPGLDPIFSEWTKLNPGSFAAHFLSAVYHVEAGYTKRGSELADKTSMEQFQAMEAEFKAGMADLKSAKELRPKLGLVHAPAIKIARSIAGPEASRAMLAEAETVDPRNVSARYAAIAALDVRWGGSLEDLDGIVERAAKSPVPVPSQRYLKYLVEETKADHFRYITKEKTRAMAHYLQAARVCASPNALWSASTMAFDLQNWQAVINTVNDYLALQPRGVAWERRGWAQEQLGHMDLALPDYEKAASSGQAWAQNKLGYLYMTGKGVPKDIARARQFFELAAAKGNVNAKANLDLLNKSESR